MNIERLTKLRDFIADLEEDDFSMEAFGFNDCGSAVCIAGWARRLFRTEYDATYATMGGLFLSMERPVYEVLGLPAHVGYELFYAKDTLPEGYDLSQVTRAHAVFALDVFVESGVADWSHVSL